MYIKICDCYIHSHLHAHHGAQVVEAGTSRLNWRSPGINEFIAEAMDKVSSCVGYVCVIGWVGWCYGRWADLHC